MIIGTLFSGIGSPEQAAKRVYDKDFKLVFACEWDKFARESFKANYEIADEHFHIDINDMDGTQYKGEVDIIVGGSPCQDFSIAGLRAGVDGHRGQLIWQYFRIIKEVEPPIFIYENVKGMVSDKGGKTLNDFLEVFRSIGYNCHFEVLNTKDYGVPQNRERVFIVGFKDIEHYYRFAFADKIPLKKRLKDLLEDEVDEKYYLSSQFIKGMEAHKERHKDRGNGFAFNPEEADNIEKVACLSCGYGSRPTDTYIKEPQLNQVGTLDIKGNDSIKRVYAADGISPTLTTMGGGNREPKIFEQRSDEGMRFFENNICGTLRTIDCCGDKRVLEPIEAKINVIGTTGGGNEMNSRIYGTDGIAPTLNAGNNGGGQSPVKHLTHDYRIRKLTPRECFRLQDFPDTFKFTVSNSQLYKQAGNSISVNVIEMIFRQIEKSRFENCDKNSLF